MSRNTLPGYFDDIPNKLDPEDVWEVYKNYQRVNVTVFLLQLQWFLLYAVFLCGLFMLFNCLDNLAIIEFTTPVPIVGFALIALIMALLMYKVGYSKHYQERMYEIAKIKGNNISKLIRKSPRRYGNAYQWINFQTQKRPTLHRRYELLRESVSYNLNNVAQPLERP